MATHRRHTFHCFLPTPAPLESVRTQAPTLMLLIPLHATLSTFYYKITLPFTSLRRTHFRISEGGQKIVSEASQWTVGKFAHFRASVIFSWVPSPQHVLLCLPHSWMREKPHMTLAIPQMWAGLAGFYAALLILDAFQHLPHSPSLSMDILYSC